MPPKLLRTVWNSLPQPVRATYQRTQRSLPGRSVDWGTLRRLEPISARYGNDRGLPVNRVYYRRFLEANAETIRGQVLEIKEDYYASELGGNNISKLIIADVDTANPKATLFVDLSVSDSLPRETFDCAIITGVLQFVSDPVLAVRNLYQSIRPGGAVLITVPTVARIDRDEGFRDRWRFNPAGLDLIAEQGCPTADRLVTGYGNVLTSVSFLMGLAAEELSSTELDHDDPSFPTVSTLRLSKPPA